MSKTVHSSITRNELTISPKRGHPKLNICKQFLGQYFLVRSSFLYFLVILFHNSWTISWSYQWETHFKYTYIPVYCCSVHNNQKLEIDSMSVNGWVDSENVACLHNRIYSPVKKKERTRQEDGRAWTLVQYARRSRLRKTEATCSPWHVALSSHCLYIHVDVGVSEGRGQNTCGSGGWCELLAYWKEKGRL